MRNSFVMFADGFEEIEAMTIVDVLRRSGMPVVTMSIYETPEAIGAHGVTVFADEMFNPELMEDAEWIILPGGMPGASNLADCEELCELLQEQNARGEKIASICASPAVVFGPLGLLEGRKATCYPGMENGMRGAITIDGFVAVDENIVTGSSPAAAADFALTIAAISMGEDVAQRVAEDMLLR